MTEAEQAAFIARLRAELVEIDCRDAAGDAGTRPVELDQQSVGRLSRMDALQNQAMAQAQLRRRAGARARTLAALARADEGEYGYCVECGDAIATARLDLDPAIATCVSCARG